MNVLEQIIERLGGNLVKEVGGIVTRQSEAHLGKKELALEIEKLVASRLTEIAKLATREIESREKVMVAELSQGDNLTKRMRPILAGSGILMALLEAVFKLTLYMSDRLTVSDLQVVTDPMLVPGIYWQGWIAVATVWGVSRGVEKVKATGRIGDVARFVTGGRKHKSLLLSGEED